MTNRSTYESGGEAARAHYLDRPLTTRNKRHIAGRMREFALSKLTGDPLDPSTWRVALRRLGCEVTVYFDSDGPVARFLPISDNPAYWGIVAYNGALARQARVRGLAHEYGHALLFRAVPQLVFSVDQVCSYHDDARDIRHQIARAFERLMVG